MTARLLLLLVGLAACGDDSSAMDSGTLPDGATDSGVSPPIAPELPAASERACPMGWSRVTGEAGSACAPWAEPPSCSEGEARFPGDRACAAVGAACPSGDFPDGLPSSTVYVLPGASGDGSRGAPLGELGEALMLAGEGGTVALGPGSHEGGVFLPRGITLRGACASRTTITATTPSSSSEPAVIMGGGAGAAIRDLTIRSPVRAGIVVQGDASEMHAEGVIIEDSHIAGVIAATGALFVGRDVVIRGTVPREDGMGGSGLSAEAGGRAELHRAVIEDNELQAVAVTTTRGSLLLEDVYVHETRSQRSDGGLGRGVTAVGGAELTMRRVVIEDSQDGGLYIDGEGTNVIGEDVVVRRTTPRTSDDAFGRGVSVVLGATATIDGLLVEDSVEAGVFVGSTSTLVTLSDALIRRTASRATDDEDGVGVLVQGGAELALARASIEASHGGGLFAGNAGSHVELLDVSIDGVVPDATGIDGHGVAIAEGASIDGTRLSIAAAASSGLFVADASSRATLADVTIRGTLSREDGGGGRGVNVQSGGTLALTRAFIVDNHETGVFVDASEASLTDVRVEATATRPDGFGGRAINAQSEATVSFSRVHAEANHEAGITVTNGSSLTGEDLAVIGTRESAARAGDGRGISVQLSEMRVTRALISDNRGLGIYLVGDSLFEATAIDIEGTQSADCAITSCFEGRVGHGHGIGMYRRSSALLRDFTIAGSEVCGLHIGEDSEVDLMGGEVSDNAIGACMQNPSLDLARLRNGVAYRDNGANLESTSLPVPMASPDL